MGDNWGEDNDSSDTAMSRILRVTFAAIAILLVGFGLAFYMADAHADGAVYDPALTPTVLVVCDAPVDRADGAPLAVDEIARIDFVQSTDGRTWAPAGSDAQCRLSLDLSAMPDGQCYYAATAVDTDGRTSTRSDAVPFVLRRLQAPSSPTNLRLEVPPA